jgi:hypothetical protein
MKEVTAVQWLINKLITENEVSLKGENYKLFELAKEMERQQIINAYEYTAAGTSHYGEQYYNETFKKK